MTQVVNFPSTEDSVSRTAALWVAKMDSGELDTDEQRALNEWIALDPTHKAELIRLAKLWDKMSDIGQREAGRESLSDNSPVKRQKRSKFREFALKTAACLAIALAIPTAVYVQERSSALSTNGHFLTEVGQQQNLELADGSEVFLNTNTVIDVDYTLDRRVINLLKGEANFDVAPDKTRPFVVKVKNGDVQALGTSFSVRVANDQVNVLVSHGTVRVNASDKAPDASPQLTNPSIQTRTSVVVGAGKQVIFNEKAVDSVTQQDEVSLAQKLYWKKGFLAFDDENLSSVVEEVSRYTKYNIVIADPDIRTLRVGGFYPIDKLETVFTSLEMNLGLRVKKVGENAYYIMKSS